MVRRIPKYIWMAREVLRYYAAWLTRTRTGEAVLWLLFLLGALAGIMFLGGLRPGG